MNNESDTKQTTETTNSTTTTSGSMNLTAINWPVEVYSSSTAHNIYSPTSVSPTRIVIAQRQNSQLKCGTNLFPDNNSGTTNLLQQYQEEIQLLKAKVELLERENLKQNELMQGLYESWQLAQKSVNNSNNPSHTQGFSQSQQSGNEQSQSTYFTQHQHHQQEHTQHRQQTHHQQVTKTTSSSDSSMSFVHNNETEIHSWIEDYQQSKHRPKRKYVRKNKQL